MSIQSRNNLPMCSSYDIIIEYIYVINLLIDKVIIIVYLQQLISATTLQYLHFSSRSLLQERLHNLVTEKSRLHVLIERKKSNKKKQLQMKNHSLLPSNTLKIYMEH